MIFAQSRLFYLPNSLAALCAALVVCVSTQARATVIHAKTNTNFCLDVAGASSTNGTVVQIAQCNGNTAQNWTVANNAIKVFGNKCLDVPNGNTAAGTKLQIWDCNASANQSFSVSGQTIVWNPAKMCLDIPSNKLSNGVRMQTWSCNNTGGQNWQLGDTAGAATGDWQLVWSDEFNGSSLDRSKWNVEVNCLGGYNNEQECYVDSTKNINVANGVLSLNVIKENYNGKAYTSGRINTSGKHSWTYGRFESRIKVPCGQGLWPAAWMLPEPNSYGIWPTSGELDFMEILGGTPNTLYGTAHFGAPQPNQKQLGGSSVKSSGDYCGDFHIYAIEWGTTQATWYVDGKAYFTLKNTDGAWAPLSHWPFDKPFYFILNLAMGGSWPGTPDSSIQKASMQVDYVRAYTHK